MSESTGNNQPEEQVSKQEQTPAQPNQDGFYQSGIEGPAGEYNEQAELKVALEAAQQEVEKSREVYLRLAADMENMRRRNAEEISKTHKFAIESFAESLLPVRDTLEMALALENQDLDTFKQGVSATLRQIEAAFERGKIVVMNPVGEKFDPNCHQAVSMVPGNSVEPAVASNHVVAVLQKGYLINERVLRPALVAVAQ